MRAEQAPSLDAGTDRSRQATLGSRDRLLAAAADLLQRRGYAGTGIAEILEKSEAKKSSLYFHFPGGKQELAVAALQQRGGEVARLIEQLVRSSPDAATAVAGFAVALAARLEDSDFQRGCALAAAALDAGPEAPGVVEAARVGYARWIELLSARLAADGVVEDPDTEALAVISALEGALIIARTQRDPEAIFRVVRLLTARWRPGG